MYWCCKNRVCEKTFTWSWCLVWAVEPPDGQSLTWNVSANFNVLYNQSWYPTHLHRDVTVTASKHHIFSYLQIKSPFTSLYFSTHKHAELINLIKNKKQTDSMNPQSVSTGTRSICSRIISIVFSYQLWYSYIKRAKQNATDHISVGLTGSWWLMLKQHWWDQIWLTGRLNKMFISAFYFYSWRQSLCEQEGWWDGAWWRWDFPSWKRRREEVN